MTEKVVGRMVAQALDEMSKNPTLWVLQFMVFIVWVRLLVSMARLKDGTAYTAIFASCALILGTQVALVVNYTGLVNIDWRYLFYVSAIAVVGVGYGINHLIDGGVFQRRRP